MKKFIFLTVCMVVILMMTSCGPTMYIPNRPYGYQPNFQRTYTDRSSYRPTHYRNFVRQNSQYLNDRNRQLNAATAQRQPAQQQASNQRSDEVYLVKNYLAAHTETKKPVYHTTYTTSYNDNGEVTTTYTTDYIGTKKETQYWKDVKREQRKVYKESRKKKKVRVVKETEEDED